MASAGFQLCIFALKQLIEDNGSISEKTLLRRKKNAYLCSRFVLRIGLDWQMFMNFSIAVVWWLSK